MKKLHLICNAHIDPVWQWEREEGIGTVLSTFRSAAEFCEEFEGFVFNHNEAIIYKWIEMYEPELFERIKKLVKNGKWNIMGGWYLQPDCNMPSGESIIRQIVVGNQYFKKKFDVKPTVAINFDSFGHSRGIIQILASAGYKYYICCRPYNSEMLLPSRDFIWKGFNHSEILVHRSDSYNSLLGKVDKKINAYLKEEKIRETGLVLWGVGNHGGGPSRKDLNTLSKMMHEQDELRIIHSTPEQFFDDIEKEREDIPIVEVDLNNTMTGCYTSQVRIKQKHNQLENNLYLTEKIVAHAAIEGWMEYPADSISKALEDLLYSEFHDILPGSSVQSVEESGLRVLEHGLEELSRIRTQAFFALSSGQLKASEGEYPILVYNPHPYMIKSIVSCEFMLADQNWDNGFSVPVVYKEGHRLLSQQEKENSNIPLDWRKRVTFAAELLPFCMNRFDCRIEVVPEKPNILIEPENGYFTFENENRFICINALTGLIDRYMVDKKEYVNRNAFKVLVMDDYCDSWGINIKSYSTVKGVFELMNPKEAANFAGLKTETLEPVRVIEDGEVRTVVEALFKYNNSGICQRYSMPKNGTEVEISIRVIFNEKDTMLKLNIPTALEHTRYLGKTIFGVNELSSKGKEMVSQDWVTLCDEEYALSCINFGTYGSDCIDNEFNMTLMRSAAYCAHTIEDRAIMPTDRFSERMDQGERIFKFIINASKKGERLDKVEYESMISHQKPIAVSYFPNQTGSLPSCLFVMNNSVIQMTALKKSTNGKEYSIRFFNPSNNTQNAAVTSEKLKIKTRISLNSFEVKTYLVSGGSMNECSILE